MKKIILITIVFVNTWLIHGTTAALPVSYEPPLLEIYFKIETLSHNDPVFIKEVRIKTIKLITRLEGFRHLPYKDSLGWAIGYGHHERIKSDLPMFITKTNALKLLEEDISKVYNYVCEQLEEDVCLDINQMTSLISFVYNIGMPGFKNSAVLKSINANKLSEVPNHMGMWIYVRNKDNKKFKSNGLIIRRMRECALWDNPLL